MVKVVLFGVFCGLGTMTLHHVLGGCPKKTCPKYNCARELKGADAEIKHQLYLNDVLVEKVREQHNRIMKLENELGKVYGKSCGDEHCTITP